MWIIPENLNISHFAPDTAVLISDLNELSEISARSLMWRSKPSPLKTWLRRFKATCSTWLLFGRILKPSLGQAFEVALTSSAAGSLANHLARQDEEVETKTLDTSGPILSEASKNSIDLPLFSWRTLQALSHQNSKVINWQTQRAHPFCYMSLENWRDWVTMRRQEYSQRVKSEHLTNESACLSWRVAPISGNQDGILFQGCLSGGEQWGTPRVGLATASGGGGNPNSHPFKFRLENQVQPTPRQEAQSSTHGNQQELQWATPLAGGKNHLSSSPKYYKSRIEKKKQVNLNGQVVLMHQIPLAKLNPRWVEALMGLPIGWTMPSCVNPWTIVQTSSDCLGMESFRQPQSERLGCYGKN